jgi:hypothetical protein
MTDLQNRLLDLYSDLGLAEKHMLSFSRVNY